MEKKNLIITLTLQNCTETTCISTNATCGECTITKPIDIHGKAYLWKHNCSVLLLTLG